MRNTIKNKFQPMWDLHICSDCYFAWKMQGFSEFLQEMLFILLFLIIFKINKTCSISGESIQEIICSLFLVFLHYRTKTIRRQPIINGGINVEIGNPSYNMYEVGHDHSEGGLLASDFTVNAEKVIFSFSNGQYATYFLSYMILALNTINRNKTVIVRFNYTIKTS